MWPSYWFGTTSPTRRSSIDVVERPVAPKNTACPSAHVHKTPRHPISATNEKAKLPREYQLVLDTLRQDNARLKREKEKIRDSFSELTETTDVLRRERDRLLLEKEDSAASSLRQNEDAFRGHQLVQLEIGGLVGYDTPDASRTQTELEYAQDELVSIREQLQTARELLKNEIDRRTEERQATLDSFMQDRREWQHDIDRLERGLAESRTQCENMRRDRGRVAKERTDEETDSRHQLRAARQQFEHSMRETRRLTEENRVLLDDKVRFENLRAQNDGDSEEPSAGTLAQFLSLAVYDEGALKPECIPLLVRLLASNLRHVQLWALESLCRLLTSTPSYRKPAFDAGCVPLLTALLESGSPSIQIHVLSILEALCGSEQACTRAVCRSAIAQTVVDLLSSSSREVQAKAADVMNEIMGWRVGMGLLASFGMLPRLNSFVSSSSTKNDSIRRIREKLDRFSEA